MTYYQNYLRSKHWKDVKTRYKKSKLYKKYCYVCKRKNLRLNLHHKTYKRIGKEKLTDLIMLCDDCHSAVHKILKTRKSNKTNLWIVARNMRKMINKRGTIENIQWWIDLN